MTMLAFKGSCFTLGYLTPKPLPTLSGQFSYHLEITVPQYQQVFNSHVSHVLYTWAVHCEIVV
ncbi:hypothetical protein DPMN_142581 [Dreissena polymorpha]|uniref:Uncharacterized protein n=1 Tax=Dreissena polymorpha TaxID=45954 RepID=A0A9D4GEH1_DREPO|nr:hypothetical protein DPMN_142581 [Dreissena polymorpha]